ncbi:hypothetical protein AWC22_18970 [Mycobacterium riyadhense]|uniref:Uncharacterized protein n=1 Tax=Mycobacterium riyadhense TaxID=486698 RepID=A0A1X2CUA3_9MYCO|nr:hypothetical protein [Mycobacterium riyadhense]MCV7145017.1 hypothetical protein [Mycobacterium riyadhense]ORW79462.1 hypothetical protein AWC22_18970 [Mycobacterium riyadhense]VTP00213.1 hypothetical protein BIN_B_03389 [Mycobacterium riyadhense]
MGPDTASDHQGDHRRLSRDYIGGDDGHAGLIGGAGTGGSRNIGGKGGVAQAIGDVEPDCPGGTGNG